MPRWLKLILAGVVIAGCLQLIGACTLALLEPWQRPSVPAALGDTHTVFVKEYPGWVILWTPSLPLVQQLCETASPGILGCASWPGDKHLKTPSPYCFIVMLNTGVVEGPDGMAEVLSHEFRHCTEGAFHE